MSGVLQVILKTLPNMTKMETHGAIVFQKQP